VAIRKIIIHTWFVPEHYLNGVLIPTHWFGKVHMKDDIVFRQKGSSLEMVTTLLQEKVEEKLKKKVCIQVKEYY